MALDDVVQLNATGVTPGSYTNTNITVDAQGRISSASNGSAGGGVSQLVAGNGITLSPASGVGTVTVTATGGGGGVSQVTGTGGITVNPTTGNVVVDGSGKLNLTGGTLTGPLNGTTASWSGTDTATSFVLASSRGSLIYEPGSTAGPATQLTAGSGLSAVLASATGSATIAATSTGKCVLSSNSGQSSLSLNADGSGTLQIVTTGGQVGGISYLGGAQTVGFTWGSPNLSVYIQATNAGTVFVTASDALLKENIAPVSSGFGLASINSLNPVSFNYLPGSIWDPTETQYGFLADDIEVDFPEAFVLQDDGQKSYNPGFIITSLVKAVQELSASLNQLQTDYDAYVASHP